MHLTPNNTTLNPVLSCAHTLYQYTFPTQQPPLTIVPFWFGGSRHGWGFPLRTTRYLKPIALPRLDSLGRMLKIPISPMHDFISLPSIGLVASDYKKYHYSLLNFHSLSMYASFDQIGAGCPKGLIRAKIQMVSLNATCCEELVDVTEAISSLSRLSYLKARFLNRRCNTP